MVGGLAAVEGARRSASCVAGAPSVVAALPAADAREVLGDPGPAGAELRFILLAAFTEALANTTQHLRELLDRAARRARRPISIACSRCFTAPSAEAARRDAPPNAEFMV